MKKVSAAAPERLYPREILQFLLLHAPKITNRVVSAFVNRYVKWLCSCSLQAPQEVPGGGVILSRWTTQDGSSYGYDPAHVAYYFGKLNQLFFALATDPFLYNGSDGLQVQEEILLFKDLLNGLSGCLGFYVLVYYLITGEDEHKQNTKKSKDTEWFAKLCNVSGIGNDVETWRPSEEIAQSAIVQDVLRTAAAPDELYYNKRFLEDTHTQGPKSYFLQEIPVPQNIPALQARSTQGECISYGYKWGYQVGHKSGYDLGCDHGTYNTMLLISSRADRIIEAERKRLVAFTSLLRKTLDELINDSLHILEESVWEETQEQSTNGYQPPPPA